MAKYFSSGKSRLVSFSELHQNIIAIPTYIRINNHAIRLEEGK